MEYHNIVLPTPHYSDEPICIVCDTVTELEVCSEGCRNRLEHLRGAILERLEDERMGARVPTILEIRQLNNIQSLLG